MTELTSTAVRSGDYLRLVRAEFAAAKKIPCPAASLPEWERSKAALREKLLQAWGGFPQGAEKPRVKTLGTLQRNGYRVEKLLLETMPEVWMTALAYVPDTPGPNSEKKLPAVLNVHGHWAGAKQDPVVQSRCQGLAKLGFFVLAVDAFGAGDRAVGTKLGEYHGSLTAATLVPTGYCLSAIQVFENMRAIDYLLTRPEVDGEKIGVTGASGGGNQSMYVGAFDERIKCVVPVCSVGSYGVYLGVACCMCEVVPGAVQWTEEAGILSLTAPRALMVINATKDAVQFSVKEATGSLRNVQPIYDLYNSGTKLKHAIFESGHDYSQAMRETMYGWMTLHLKGTGDGSPIAEPKLELEDREQLRCYPEGSRPEDFVTLPRFAARVGKELVAKNQPPTEKGEIAGWSEKKREVLRDKLLGGFPLASPLHVRIERHADPEFVRVWYQAEPGLEVIADVHRAEEKAPWGIVVHLDKFAETRKHPVVAEMLQKKWNVAVLNPRGVGELSPANNLIANAADHNTAEWGLWTGKPLLGGWTWDVLRFLSILTDWKIPAEVPRVLIGLEQGGVCTLSAGIFAEGLTSVGIWNGLASYVSETPYVGQLIGSVVPGILREVGDIPTLAGLVRSPLLSIAGGKKGGGEMLSKEELEQGFNISGRLREGNQNAGSLKFQTSDDAGEWLKSLIGPGW